MGTLLKRCLDLVEQGVPVENGDNEYHEKYSKAAIQLRMRHLSRTEKLKAIKPESEEVALLPAAVRKSKQKKEKLSDCVLNDDDDNFVPAFVDATSIKQNEQSSSDQSHTLDRSRQQIKGNRGPITVSDNDSEGFSDDEENDRIQHSGSDYPREPLLENNRSGSQGQAHLIDLDELRRRHDLPEGDEDYLARDHDSVYDGMSGKYIGEDTQRKKQRR